MTFAVRRAAAGDLDRMVELYRAVAAEGRWLGAEAPVDGDDLRRRWADREAAGEGVLLVAEASGVLVGLAGIDAAPYGVGSLGMLVDRDWRRRGVGRALVVAAVDAARELGCHKVSLQVWPHNDAARALYRSLDFEEEGVLRRHYRRRNGDLWDAVIMGLALPLEPEPVVGEGEEPPRPPT